MPFTNAAVIPGGNIQAAVSITPLVVVLNSDGSFNITLDVALNGAHRSRVNFISADGLSFKLDGVDVVSTPNALLALGAHLAGATAKITSAYSVPGVIALLAAP